MTVFTSGQNDEKAGLTISSLVIAEGEPAVLLAVVDPLSRLQEQAIETGRLVVHVLGADEARIAGLFAGNYPGDPFEATEYEESEYGPVLVGDRSVVRCRYLSSEPLGFQGLLRAEIRSIELADDRHDPLVWYRGRYRRLSPDPD